jgi:hypothetical protein
MSSRIACLSFLRADAPVLCKGARGASSHRLSSRGASRVHSMHSALRHGVLASRRRLPLLRVQSRYASGHFSRACANVTPDPCNRLRFVPLRMLRTQVREELLELDTMEDLHTFLVNFNPYTGSATVDALAMKAVKLLRDLPPERMARRCRGRFAHCCAVEAALVANAWWVPEEPPKRGQAPLARLGSALSDAKVGALVVPVMAAGAVTVIGLWSLSGGGLGNFDQSL